MSSSEPQPENKETEGEGQETPDEPNLADFLTPAYLEYFREFLSLIPQLDEVLAYLPEGTILEMEDWIFPTLERCKELTGGWQLIRVADPTGSPTWVRCYGAGMPKDMPPLNFYCSGAHYHEKYKDFAIHAQGILGDPENPDKGKGGWQWNFTRQDTGKKFTLHLWTRTIYLRNSTTQLIAHYNSGTNPVYSEITQTGEGVRVEMTDLNLSDPASSHLLIDSAVLLTNSQQILDAALAEPQPREPRYDRERVNNIIRNIAKALHLERLTMRPFSFLAPEPFHFPQYSKLDKPCLGQEVICDGPEMETLHNHYGFPRGLPQMIVTYQGERYGSEFADFTIELFGLKGDTSVEDEVIRLEERTIGDNVKVSNVDPDSLLYGSGGTFSLINTDTGECDIKIHVWRQRIFMDNSAMCLELNWHYNERTGGGWIPYVLGIQYADDPEKAVADGLRFARAYKLCNLVKADLSQKRGGHLIKNIEKWTQKAIEDMAQESKRKGKIIPYSLTWFSRVFPYQTSRPNIYTLLTPQEVEGLEDKYIELCNKLMI